MIPERGGEKRAAGETFCAFGGKRSRVNSSFHWISAREEKGFSPGELE